MKRKVIVTPDPRLRKKSTKAKAGDPETTKIIQEMIQSCIEWENEHEFELSAAMAAPQLGYNKRIIVVREDMNDKENVTFIPLLNPEVIKTEGKTLYDYEGCLSVPAIYGKVPRPTKARIKAQLETGEEFVVQRKKNSKWKDVKYITKEEVSWLAMARIIPKGEKSNFDVDWEWLYGKLSAGEYRIGKEFMNFRGTGDFDEQVIYAEFTIKE